MYCPRTTLVIDRTKTIHLGMSLDIYEAFMRIVEQGSVSAAARVLGVPRPTVSRRLSRLEQRMGERLIQRGGRHVSVTRAGHTLYQRISGPIAELHAIERAFADRADSPRGLLRIALGPMTVTKLTPLLLQFQLDYPEVSLEVFTENRFAALDAEGFDVAIRGGALQDPKLIQRRLLTLGVGLVASPTYLEQRGIPTSPSDLANHRLLRSYSVNDKPRPWWPLRGGGKLAVTGSFVTNDRWLLRSAAIEGHGIALLSNTHAQPAIDTGTLVPVLSADIGTEIGLQVVYPERALLRARSRLFIERVVALFA